MKKILVLMLAVAAAVSFAATDAGAQALGPHRDSAGGTYVSNPCRACHNTAAATAALRGWAMSYTLGGSGWSAKGLSYLCYTCHDSGGGVLIVDAHSMANNAFADTSHSYVIGDCPVEPNGAAQGTNFGDPAATGLPYMLGTEMECTSCHNVHVSIDRPFNQRAGYQAMCVECHGGHEANAAAPGTRSIAIGTDVRSLHPTNQAMGTSNTGRANLKTVAEMDAFMKTAIGGAPNYALGGHLSSADGQTGNIDCQTCHAVHGPTLGSAGTTSLLAIDNNNDAGATSAVCEGCHWGGDGGEQVGTWTTATAGEYSDHPIDALINRTFYPTGVALPDGGTVNPLANIDWTDIGTPNNDIGAAVFTADATPGPRCSTCHDTHGGLPATALLRGPSADDTGAAIWTFTYDEWCFVCHLNGQVIPNNHHSNVNNDEGTFVSQLSCGDCHGAVGQTDWTAHNGFWRFEIAVGQGDSAFCTSCHNSENPRDILAGPKNQTYTDNAFPATHGTPNAAGTVAGAQHQTDGNLEATNANVMTGLTTQPSWAWASGGTSEWGGTNNGPICESCHNILTNGTMALSEMGLTQGWKANLLLAPYEDDGSGNLAGGAEAANDFYGSYAYGTGNTGDRFCRTCHNTGAAGHDGTANDFVHNPEAHTRITANYTYAAGTNPYGRTTATVMTGGVCTDVGGATTADATSAPNRASYPADNTVNCDSCHRAHNADPDSFDVNGPNRYLILEATDADAWGTTLCLDCHNTDTQCNN